MTTRIAFLMLALMGCSTEDKASSSPGDTAAVDRGGPDSGTPDDRDPDDDSGSGDTAGSDSGESGSGSAGCGLPAGWAPGGVQIEIDAGVEGDGLRGAYLVIPSDYDPEVPHRLVLGFPGTNWVGYQIRGYLSLEGRTGQPEIFVYPDPLWRDFPGWGNYGGWVLGPHAYPANGMGDLVFTEKLLDHLEENLCIDTSRVFATGHSWGGDMAQVVGCFLGDRVRASAPAAANRPYWFETGGGWTECVGDAAMWTWFGINDTHFTMQSYPGEFGDQCNEFWLDAYGCDEGATTDLGFEEPGTCVSYTGCASEVRYCLYGPDAGHGIPSYFPGAVMEWFAGL